MTTPLDKKTCKLIRGAKIGSGVYANVVRNGNIAIKRYKNKRNPCPDFLMEVSIMSVLNHPNLIRAINIIYNEKNGELAIGMDAMHQDLNKWLYDSDNHCERDIKIIAFDVAHGLSELHRHNILHGDIKPSNILVDVNEEGLVTAKLCDFGFSIACITDLTSGPLFYAPLYRDPKILKVLGTHNIESVLLLDVYAYGVVIFEMLNCNSSENNSIIQDCLCVESNVSVPSTLEELAGMCVQKRISTSSIIGLDFLRNEPCTVTPQANQIRTNITDVPQSPDDVIVALHGQIDSSKQQLNADTRAHYYLHRLIQANSPLLQSIDKTLLCKHLYYFACNIIGPIEWYPPPEWGVDYRDISATKDAMSILEALKYNLL